jgi:Tol biopolymer transport system component/DNA-binding winged helix-turn-helix (wHTH) protein
MDGNGRSAQIIRFGVFEADLGTAELRKNGTRVPLQGQPFQVFAILLERPGELATREELRKKVWPEDTFVDFEHSLNTSVAKIRVALGDDADNPRFVETLPRRGYRFICPVQMPISQETKGAVEPEAKAKKFTTKARWMVGLGSLAVVLAGIGMWRVAKHREGAPSPPLEVVPLSGMGGNEESASFSPDGNQVVFTFHGEGKSGIYSTVLDGERSLRLTSFGGDCCARWSPDSRQIAFSRPSGEGSAKYVIPALGGTERLLYLGPGSQEAGPFDWSPDGKVLAISESQTDKSHNRIVLLSMADLSKRPLSTPSGQELDYGPAFSPDGLSVAFVRGIVAGVVADIYVVPTQGGAAKRLTFDGTWIMSAPSWTPDGRELVFASSRGGLSSLWRVPVSGGTPRPVVGGGALAFSPDVSPKGNQLVYERLFFKDNLWRVNLKDETHREGEPISIASEKGLIWRPQVSPDGKRIAFETNRSGYSELWACDNDGANRAQLTSLRGTAGAPRWSPDGKTIAFEFRPQGHSEVYLLDLSTGAPRLLTTLPGADNGGPSWSRDGKWIYFYSDRGGGAFQLWKISAAGGTPVQVTKNGGVIAAESADGQFLYYSKIEAPGVWKMPLNGGEESQVVEQPEAGDWANWALVKNGIYFFDSKSKDDQGVRYFDFSTRKIAKVSASKSRAGVGIAVSADGKTIFYDQNEDAESTIMLVKNFR